MAKKHRKTGAPKPETARTASSISRKGRKFLVAGIASLAAGFFLLTRTDMYGRNWASHLSPFLILGAYALIAAGLLSPSDEEGP